MKNIKTIFALAVLAIPTTSMEGWRIERFGKTRQNEVTASKSGLRIRIRNSASPLIYPLKSPVRVGKFTIEGKFFGLPKFSNASRQGQKGFDDYALRLGLVVPGDRRLTGVKAIFTPLWIKNLFHQVPEGMGLGHIQFFNFTQNPTQVGKSRIHPISDLMREDFVTLIQGTGEFKYEHTLVNPIEAAAVWISIDGDDTSSEYEVLISRLEFQEPD